MNNFICLAKSCFEQFDLSYEEVFYEQFYLSYEEVFYEQFYLSCERVFYEQFCLSKHPSMATVNYF